MLTSACGRDLLSPGEGVRGAGEMDPGGCAAQARVRPARAEECAAFTQGGYAQANPVTTDRASCPAALQEATQGGESLGPCLVSGVAESVGAGLCCLQRSASASRPAFPEVVQVQPAQATLFGCGFRPELS